jgi:hypothetical protein
MESGAIPEKVATMALDSKTVTAALIALTTTAVFFFAVYKLFTTVL